jgi:hypothetical protein
MRALHVATHRHVAAAAAAAVQAAPQAAGGTSQSLLRPAAMMKLLTGSCSGATRTGQLACPAAAAGAGAVSSQVRLCCCVV